MKLITGFEEEFATTDKPPASPIKDFSQIPEALKHDHNVAENVFARGAKKELKQILTDTLKSPFSIREGSACLGLCPFWVGEISITLRAGDSSLPDKISRLVQCLADSIIKQIGDDAPILVDPLQVRLVHVGDQDYQFRLKQKWTVELSIGKGEI